MHKEYSVFDCIVVGGGPAGLAALFSLNNFNCLLLERNEHLGGRILTRCQNGICYDLGAIIGFDTKKLPFQHNFSEIVLEDGLFGIYHRGKKVIGNDVSEVLSSFFSDKKDIQTQIKNFRENFEIDKLSSVSYKFINTFFRRIHPGEMKQYAKEVWPDAFRRYYPSHYIRGNIDLIDAFKQKVKNKIICNCTVTGVVEKKDQVIIQTEDGVTYRAKTCIVATPSNLAQKLVGVIKKHSKQKLKLTRYASFIIVVFGVKRSIGNFTYMVTPSLKTNLIGQQKPINNIHIVHVFFGQKEYANLKDKSDSAVFKLAYSSVKKISDTELSDEDIAFRDIYRWECGGTIIKSCDINATAFYEKTSEKIFKSGDYLFSPYPYGIYAAISSGLSAGKQILSKLTH